MTDDRPHAQRKILVDVRGKKYVVLASAGVCRRLTPQHVAQLFGDMVQEAGEHQVGVAGYEGSYFLVHAGSADLASTVSTIFEVAARPSLFAELPAFIQETIKKLIAEVQASS
jgi:hypothetical protein